MTRGGLPHSDIFGSKLVCSSPKLFAACHVLHRLLAPRHSPYTLSSLTIRNSKLTLTNRLHVDWSATVPCETLRVLWSEKTTVCRIFSCQRSACRNLQQSVYVGYRFGAPAPRSATTTQRRRRCARDSKASLAHRNFSKASSAATDLALSLQSDSLSGLPTEARASSERKLVENTGLEPVTSWLQTRRSPS